MDENFNTDIVDIVNRAISKANHGIEYIPEYPLMSTRLEYQIKQEKSLLQNNSQRILWIHGISGTRSFFDRYINECRKQKVKPNHHNLIKTMITADFFNSLIDCAEQDIFFQFTINGLCQDHDKLGIVPVLRSETLICRMVKPGVRGLFFRQTYNDLSDEMRSIVSSGNIAISAMRPNARENLVFDCNQLLEFCINYM